MGWMDEYNALKKKRKEEESKGNSTTKNTNATAKSSGSSWIQEYNDLKAKRLAKDAADGKIANKITVGRLTSPKKEEDEDDRKWYQKGHFEDGYDFGDIAKTILGVDEDSASFMDLTWNSAKRGYLNSRYGEETYKAMYGKKNDKDAYKKLLESDEFQFTPGNDFASGVSGAFEQVGQMFRQYTHPRTLAAVTAAVGGAAALGNAGPQVLVPEEIVTVPVAAVAGFTAGSAASSLEIEAGHAYNEMVELGVKEDIARKIATAVGVGNASLEAFQVDELADAYKATKATGATKTFAKVILDELVKRGVDVLKETAQEDVQELVTIGGVQAAHKLDKGEFAYSADDVANRLLDTTKSSLLSFGMMNVPAAAINTISTIRNQKQTNNTAQKENVFEAPIVEEKSVEEQTPVVDENPVAEQVQPEVKPKRVLYTGSPNTDIKQFKVGGGERQTGDRYGRGIYLTTNEGTAKNYAGENGRVYRTNVDDLNIFNLNDTVTPEMRDSLIRVFNEGDTQFRNSMLRNFRTEQTFDDFESAEAFFDHQRKVWKEQDGEYSANKPEIKEADYKTGKAVIEFTDFENWENNIGSLTGNQLYDALKSLSTDDFSSFITGHGFDGISFDEDADNQQYVIYRNEDRIRIDEDIPPISTQHQETQLSEDNSTELASLYQEKQDLEDRMTEMGTMGFLDDMPVVSERYGQVQQRIAELEGNEPIAESHPDYSDGSEIPVAADVNLGASEVAATSSLHPQVESLMENMSLEEIDGKNHTKMVADGFVIIRRKSSDGKRFNYTIYAPDGRSMHGQTKSDIADFYDAVEFGLSDLLYGAEQTNLKNSQTKPSKPLTSKEKVQQHLRENVPSFEEIFESETPENVKKYRAALKAAEQAQRLISEGAEGVKSIPEIFSKISADGKLDAFEEYLHHMLNVDRSTVEERFGQPNRPVFGHTAKESQEIADKLAEENPDFKKAAEEVYAFNDYVLDIFVKSGARTQEQADHFRELYPHYVPISRSRHGNSQDYSPLLAFLKGESKEDSLVRSMEDYDLGLDEAEKFHGITSSGYDFNPLIDTMVNQAFVAHLSLGRNSPDSFAPILTDTQMDETVASAPEVVDDSSSVPAAEATVYETETESKTETLAEESDEVQPTDYSSMNFMEQPGGIKGAFRDVVHWIERNILDDARPFEKIDIKNGDRNLHSHWHAIRNAFSSGQYFIGHGNEAKGVRALNDIYAEIKKMGLNHDFGDYLAHQRNIDGKTLQSRFVLARNDTSMRGFSAADSYKEVLRLESEHPEFKNWANDIYANTDYLLNQMVEHKMLSQDMADIFKELYPHYVPMRYSQNGTRVPSFEALGQYTMDVFNSLAMNDFALELKNTLNSEIQSEPMDINTFIARLDSGRNLFDFDRNGKDNGYHTFTIYENGELKTFDITNEMYKVVNDTHSWMDWKIPVLYQANEGFRKATTELNWIFAFTNAARDPQEIIWNSQHPLETYAKLLPAEKAVWFKDSEYRHYYEEYLANGGEQFEYYNPNKHKFDADKGVLSYLNQKVGTGAVSGVNARIETAPRLAEYIASREAGKSVQEAMLDAAQVTVNFQAGGKLTKFLNRNGCTFLNASVQGTLQHARNIYEGKQNAWKGLTANIAKGVAVGLASKLGTEFVKMLNELYWGDDEEYEELPEYITQNYYLFGKFGDGTWLRIPKGRTNATVEEAIRQVALHSTGDDEADWKEFWKLFAENMAPNNPMTNNLLAPILEVANNTTWYGEDLVPYRLKDLPATEQFDEKTDAWSVWLGEKLDYSPKKINYLLNSYSGVVGDTLLPFATPKAESPDDSLLGKLVAPLRDKFTTDSVLNNRVTGDFYDTLEAAEAKAESDDATQEDKLVSSYLIYHNAEISKLMQQQRDIQTSDLPDSEKYKQNRDLKKQINEMQKKALEGLDKSSVNGIYAEVGDKRFNYDSGDERWYEIKPKKSDGDDNWYYQQEQAVTNDLGISHEEYWNNKKMYDDFYFVASGFDKESSTDDMIETARSVFGYKRFADYASVLKTIKADKDKNGESIDGTRFPKVQEYVNSLDIPDIEKKILMKMQYPNYNKHNYEIVKWLDENDDISYTEWIDILGELGYKVDSNNHVTW